MAFSPKTYEQILLELETAVRGNVDSALDLSPTTPLGQLLGIFAEQLASAYESAEVAYNAFDIEKSEGQSLDGLVLLNGLTRIPARKSTVTLTVNLNSSVTVPAGSIVAVTGQPNNRFITKASVTSTTAGNYQVEAESEFAGPFVAVASSLTTIVTPVSGWNTVTNAADATIGRNVETDAELRIRFKASQADSGQATTAAIRAAVLAVKGVISVTVLENTTDSIDSNGLPPHSFECVVYEDGSASNDEIAQAIWDNKPAGIPTFGSLTGNATDEFNATQVVRFSKPTLKPVYIDVSVADAPNYAGDNAVKAAIVDAGTALAAPGVDVIALRLRAAALGVLGVFDVPVFELGFSPAPTATANLPIGVREIATFNSLNITVTVI